MASLGGEFNAPIGSEGHIDLGLDASYGERLAYLESLPANGWTFQRRLREIRELTARSGCRVEPMSGIHLYSGVYNNRDRNMAWQNGNLIVYPQYWRGRSLHSRLSSIMHEVAGHGLDPAKPNSRWYYGDEDRRLQAQQYNEQVASQCLNTEVYLDEGHAECARLYKDGEVSRQTFNAETWARHVQHTLSGHEAHLAEVMRLQEQVLRDSYADEDRPELIPIGIQYDTNTPGIEQFLIHGALYGVRNVSSLQVHITSLRVQESTILDRYEGRPSLVQRALGYVALLSHRVYEHVPKFGSDAVGPGGTYRDPYDPFDSSFNEYS